MEQAMKDGSTPAELGIGPSAEKASHDGDEPNLEEMALRNYMLYVLIPLWFVPGVLDWYWHRKTKIEETSGTHESLTHGLMMTSLGVPLLSGLFFDINALVLTMMAGGFLTHEAISYWDVNYAKNLREVPTVEQHTHSFLEVLPFMMTSFCIVLKWKQFVAIFGRGDEKPRWRLEFKKPGLSPRYVAGVLAASAAFVALPYGEEFVRCYRKDHTLRPHHPPS
jgi:hypothetical protein